MNNVLSDHYIDSVVALTEREKLDRMQVNVDLLLAACKAAAEFWKDTDAPTGQLLRDAIAAAEGTT